MCRCCTSCYLTECAWAVVGLAVLQHTVPSVSHFYYCKLYTPFGRAVELESHVLNENTQKTWPPALYRRMGDHFVLMYCEPEGEEAQNLELLGPVLSVVMGEEAQEMFYVEVAGVQKWEEVAEDIMEDSPQHPSVAKGAVVAWPLEVSEAVLLQAG